MSSTAPNTKSMSKGAKKSRMVTLKLSPDLLSRFPADIERSSSATIKDEASPSVQIPDTTEKSSESNSTPIPSNANEDTDANSLAPPKANAKRRSGGGTITGRKRAPPAIDPEGPSRERGRPGPKKKPRLPDGTIDRTTSEQPTRNPMPAPNPTGGASHKLGPKANTGAINAGLRALDRTGKPCRRWERKPLALKSFTGSTWAMPSWNAPVRDLSFSGDVKSDSTGSSELKGSSALPSEQDQMDVDPDGRDQRMVNGVGSSPAPRIAI